MTPNPQPPDRTDTEELLLELLDMPISFHRCFVGITGKVTAALLLSYLWWSTDEPGPSQDGWMPRPLDRIRDETGLSRDELASARHVLRALDILDDRRRGMPPVVEFRIDRDRVARLLLDHARIRRHSNRMAPLAHPGSGLSVAH